MTQMEMHSPLPREIVRAGDVPLDEDRARNDGDQDLLLALRTGSGDAFDRLQKLYSNRLYKRILSITGNHEDAEDALQDTFMRAFLAFDSFQGRSRLITWLTRIAINSALIILRRRRFHIEVSLASGAEDAESEIRDAAPTPEEICCMKQRFERVSSAIERLDPTSRTAITIRVAQDCSMKEIADTLDVSLATVKARLHRARKSLARLADHKSGMHASQNHGDFKFRVEQEYA